MSAFDELVSELRELQGNRCGICGIHNDRERLVVDHDHKSGMVRGLLCGPCNNREGRHGWCDVTSTCPTCRWVEQPAVSWIGWTTHYVSSRGTLPTGALLTPFAPSEELIADLFPAMRKAVAS